MTKRPAPAGVGRSASEREARHLEWRMPNDEIHPTNRSVRRVESPRAPSALDKGEKSWEDQPVIDVSVSVREGLVYVEAGRSDCGHRRASATLCGGKWALWAVVAVC